MRAKTLLKNLSVVIFMCVTASVSAQTKGLEPILHRVNVQADSAKIEQVIDDAWVAVGTKAPHVIQHDNNLLFNGKPSYRFELRVEDNTLSGYSAGETKGRAELSYCYATSSDLADKTSSQYGDIQKMKCMYHYGKGIIPQAAKSKYTFSIYVPSALADDVSTIFAQWHGMPTRTLVQTPEGEVKMISTEEFLKLYDVMAFKKNTGYDLIKETDKKGEVRTKTAKKPNGWLIEQGGYPPLAFGFSQGQFYIKANSDRRWLTDKTDRTNASTATSKIMVPRTSKYKASTIAYKEPFADFPKDCWVTFDIEVDWTEYDPKTEEIVNPGRLDVVMKYENKNKKQKRHIVDNEEILVGRNDPDGYYFKFGIYRVGGSTEPVCYNLAGFTQK